MIKNWAFGVQNLCKAYQLFYIKTGRQEGMEMLVANFLKKDNRVKYTVEMLGVSEEMVLEVAKKLGIEIIS